MAAPKGNKYWQFRDKHGRDYKYTPKALWEEAILYFEWIEKNPLLEQKLFAYQGVVTKENATKMRAMTIIGFCLFADINPTTWKNYKETEDFITITTRIDNLVYSQKFEGAAADLLNANIIARDLGLADKQEIKTEDKNDLSKYTYEELLEISKGSNPGDLDK